MIVLALVGLAAAACSGWATPDAVFEEVTHQGQDCPADVPDTHDCLLVTASVVGQGQGRGSCTVVAAGDGRNIEATATSEEWVLDPGQVVRWEVGVERPDTEDFRGWNPVCAPMAEG